MAQSNVLLSQTFNLSSNYNHLSANTTGYFLCMRIGDADMGAGRVEISGARVIGINQEPQTKGRGVEVAVDGVSKVRCGTTVTRGNALQSDKTARAIPYKGSEHAHIFGVAWMSGGTGDVITAKIGGIGWQPTGSIAGL